MIALVVGGADCVLADLDLARDLLGGARATAFVTNDMLADYPEACVGVTLHPDKLTGWLDRRRAAGFPAPSAIWAHRRSDPMVTNVTNDWAGSVSLFAVKIALDLGFDRVVVCGAPLTPTRHYARGKPWTPALGYRPAWKARLAQIGPFTRSCSGWTRDLLGAPSVAWLTGGPEHPAGGAGRTSTPLAGRGGAVPVVRPDVH